jgi:hypothetical protein
MDKFKCELCSEIFSTKFNLERHLLKKNKCNTITEFKCSKCNKYFKFKKNLKEHEEKNICKNFQIILSNQEEENVEFINEIKQVEDTKTNNNDLTIKNAIKGILLSETLDVDSKIELLKVYNIKTTDDKLKKAINSDINFINKIDFIFSIIDKPIEKNNNTNNINNGTINTTQTTNNIQINNFGNEKLEYLDNEYFKDLIMNNHIQTAYMKLIEDTYLHKDHPENHNIKIENLNSKYGFVFENGRWRAIVKYELKELMHEKNNKLLKIHYKRLKEFLTAAKKSSINVFFSRKYDHDPHLKLMNDQMVLLFYEGKKS